MLFTSVLRVFNSLHFAESKGRCGATSGRKAENTETSKSLFSSSGLGNWRDGRRGMG